MEIESRLLSLLSALEANGVNNCKIEIENLDCASQEVERTGRICFANYSSSLWLQLQLHKRVYFVSHFHEYTLDQLGIRWSGRSTCIGGGNTTSRGKEALDQHGNNGKPVHVWRNVSFIAAFPSPKVPAIGSQWFSSAPLDESVYEMRIASSRTFCIYEEVYSLSLHQSPSYCSISVVFCSFYGLILFLMTIEKCL
ncbi:hypothetical protein Patl1_15538 [Pistacia atlantica]|uniref:Uncharacterized protein n=1 Tax=Pistacia atlantica TaxID=434234 RepID=A0ACC1B990_9ROSI|nr:hypothetical protein Patl1_15538 [Pistacia atlantica]